MLHRNTVEGRTFDLFVELSKDPKLKNFFLVGGTALSLQLGHRKSVDLDLFTHESFDPKSLTDHLKTAYANRKIEVEYQFSNTLMVKIDDIKVDFIRHTYPLLKPLIHSGPLRLASLDDIGAMKVNAIVQSGERMKDFVDIAEIARHRTIYQVVDAYRQKYPEGVPEGFASKAISYFNDVEIAERPEMMRGKLDWKRTQQLLIDFAAGKDMRQV